MAAQCNYLHYFTHKPCVRKSSYPSATAHSASHQETPFPINSDALKISKPRFVEIFYLFVSESILSAVLSSKFKWNCDNLQVVESSDSGTDVFELTYLEGNSWIWEVGGATISVDPILVGNLDFGIPWLYEGAKNFKLDDHPEIDCILIIQSLDDHCHLKTLQPLSQKLPNLKVLSTPNAKQLLDPLFISVTYLEPGEGSEIQVKDGSSVKVRATAGPVLGPPWQRPENGYLVTSPNGKLTLYYEPHCVYDEKSVEKEGADIVITPVIKQLLPYFLLVSGQEDAVRLAKLLQAKFIVPMRNGELESKGLLASIIKTQGTMESFKELLLKELPDAKVLEAKPGVSLEI